MAISRGLALGVLMSIVATAAVQADPIGQAPAVDGYVNLGTGPYADSTLIANGTPTPWYTSSAITRLFGGTPTFQQALSFDQAVMQDVQQTFQSSGVSITLSDNPNVAALHSLSLVANASSAAFNGAIGTTILNGSGLSFIDPIAAASQSLNQLELIAAHNIAHELMLAFGVGEYYDQSGNYIDSTNANFAMMVNPNATFSAGAAQALRNVLSPDGSGQIMVKMPQMLNTSDVTPAPEPATMVLWGSMAALAMVAGRRYRRDA